MENRIKSIYSVSFINGKVAGISTIDRMFGELLQLWEGKTQLAAISGSKKTEDISMQRTKGIAGETEENIAAMQQTKNLRLKQKQLL